MISGAVSRVQVGASQVEFLSGDLNFRIRCVSDSVVQVTATPRASFPDRKSHFTLPPSQEPANLQWETKDSHYLLQTGKLTLKISKTTGAFSWHDYSGTPLLSEKDREALTFREVDVLAPLRPEDVESVIRNTVDGEKVETCIRGSRTVARTAFQTRHSFCFSDGEAIYGLGQHEEGILNHRGRMQFLYQNNMKVAMPVMVSSRGYALFRDTSSPGLFRDDEHGSCFWTDCDDAIDYYFIYGPELDQIVASMRALTGRPTMSPDWAYGYIQSKERYHNQEEIESVASEFRDRGIPIDCIVQDWHYWPEGTWSYKTFDTTRYPDPAGMIKRLHDMDLRFMISIWPRMIGEPNGDRREMEAAGHLFADGVTYNAFDPEARALYWKQAEAGLFRHGVDAWWCDCTEPFESDWNGRMKQEPFERYWVNTDEAARYYDRGQSTAYSMVHSKGIYEGQRGADSTRRVMNLTRSGSPGQQRYGAVTWSGDTVASWETLRRQIADGLNFTVTGNPKWTMDIGAFFTGEREEWFYDGQYPQGAEDPGYRELYVRWLQFGAFLPYMRSHGTDTPREPWRFGEPGEIFYDAILKMIQLRYRLLPYFYSLAGRETHSDYTMFRNLAFDFRADPDALDVKDQFMCGPSLLVCPVTQPMMCDSDSGSDSSSSFSRDVYLPSGCEWYDFWSGERYDGGQRVAAACPLDRVPLFVRAGSVLPMAPEGAQSSREALRADEWELRVFPGPDSRFEVYEDAGDGYGYEKGEFSFFSLEWISSEERLRVGARSGDFPGKKSERVLRCVPQGGAGCEKRLVFTGDNVLDVHWKTSG